MVVLHSRELTGFKHKRPAGLSPDGLDRLLPRNEKTTGARLSPPVVCAFYRQLFVNRVHPGQARRKSCQTKSKKLQTTNRDDSLRHRLFSVVQS
jgi:hypothetical protein